MIKDPARITRQAGERVLTDADDEVKAGEEKSRD